jgi:phosphodiesterase/alkaline phosphatase D-like protein
MRAGRLFTAVLGLLLAKTGVVYSQDGNLSVTTNDAAAVTISTAELQGALSAGSAPSAGWFEWGPTAALGSKTDIVTFADGSAAISFAQSLKSLQPHTTYYFRAVGYRSLEVVSGDIKSFTTVDGRTTTTNLAVTTGEVTTTTLNTAALNGTVNPGVAQTSVWFNWGTTPSMGMRTEMQTFTGNSSVAITHLLKNLQPHTTYYFRAEAYRPSDGAVVVGDVKSFTTADAPYTSALFLAAQLERKVATLKTSGF